MSTISALGTHLVLYSSFIPFSNAVVEAFYPHVTHVIIPAANNNLSAVIWSVGICIQPTIIIMLRYLRPHPLSYIFPVFTSLYATSFYLLPIFGYTPKENFWFFFWLLMIVVLFLASMQSINIYLRVQKIKEDRMLNVLKNLSNNRKGLKTEKENG